MKLTAGTLQDIEDNKDASKKRLFSGNCIYQTDKKNAYKISIKNVIKTYTLPQIYQRKKEYLMDDSIDAFKFLEYICLENVSVSISETPGTGKTSFMLLVKDLPKYQFLNVFQSPSFTLKNYPQHLPTRDSERLNKQPKLDSEIIITKQNIFDLYSQTIIALIDLREIIDKASEKYVLSDFYECFVVMTMNKEIIKFIKENTILDEEQLAKLKTFEESNTKFQSDINVEEINNIKSNLINLRGLYKKITEYIHSEITSSKLKRNPQENLNSLNEEEKSTYFIIRKFIIMIDEANILQSKRYDHLIDTKFTEITKNVIINTIAYTKSTKKEYSQLQFNMF